MTTRADLRARVRADLNDTGAAQLWSDADLDRWLGEAIRAWSIDAPAQRTTSLSSVKGQPDYTLPADLLQVLRVEHPPDTFRTPASIAGGDTTPDLPSQLVSTERGERLPGAGTYDVFAGLLTLDPAPDAAGQAIVVRYLGTYAVPSSDATVLDLPALDEDPVVWLACGFALRWLGADESKRLRFERSRGADPLTIRRGFERQVKDAIDSRARRRTAGHRRLVPRS